jgi:hypothetical protein
MVGQDREGTNRLQQAKWELTSRIRDESNVPKRIPFLPAITAFHAAPAQRFQTRRVPETRARNSPIAAKDPENCASETP